MRSVEMSLNAILNIPLIQNSLLAVEAATVAANAAATNANSAVVANKKEASLINSYVTGFTGAVLSATSAGIVTIGAHKRAYGDSIFNPTVDIAGATISTGATPGSVVRVYYIDQNRVGGSVTFLYTVDPTPPPVQSGNTHSIGAITIPANGTSSGNILNPPGYVKP